MRVVMLILALAHTGRRRQRRGGGVHGGSREDGVGVGGLRGDGAARAHRRQRGRDTWGAGVRGVMQARAGRGAEMDEEDDAVDWRAVSARSQ
ncbi:hypothetical protein K438DRAFT_1944151, partial [Mycena galopus ATCC 62051]